MPSCNTRSKMKTNGTASMCLWMLIVLAIFATSNAVESDISCLRSFKESLEDPEQVLSTWDFNNNTEGFICRFTGVECWHPDESKVLNIRLPDMGLRGPFPMGIRNCTSLTGLDLSVNHLSGPIPSNLSNVLPFISTLDLSNNNLSGPIPPTIANCSFINVLRLDNNHLTGQIPPELSQLPRLKEFSVANNRLSGPVPYFINNSISAESYANNLGLCGGALKACKDEDHDDDDDDDDLFLSGFAVGFPIFTILSMLFMFFCSPRMSIRNMFSSLLPIKKTEGRKHHLIPGIPQILLAEESSSNESSLSLSLSCNYVLNTQVTAMEELIRRLSLLELEKATAYFDSKNVIGYGNMGVMYKAMFLNDLPLAVKRVHKFESFEKEFLTEIKILGRLRQTNLVPLLGFCFEMEKKFLVYKYMCNGTLHHWLHCRPQVEANKMMGWTSRFKIAVGIARGLAWLHHNNVLRAAHLKISSKCILLDDQFEPKISNFGDAVILMNASGTPSSGCNFVVPDSSPYKEDVYRFEILLLELVTGREPSTWINSLADLVCGMELSGIDECLMGQGFDEEIHETLRIAESCIHRNRDEATSMLQVYQAMRSSGISRNEISVTI